MSSLQSMDQRSITPAFGVPSVPPAQQMPPEFQAALTAAQNSLPPWARWVFMVAIGPLLLTTYNEAKVIFGVPEAQRKTEQKMQLHDKEIKDLFDKMDTLSNNVGTLTTNVNRLVEHLAYTTPPPTSQPRK